MPRVLVITPTSPRPTHDFGCAEGDAMAKHDGQLTVLRPDLIARHPLSIDNRRHLHNSSLPPPHSVCSANNILFPQAPRFWKFCSVLWSKRPCEPLHLFSGFQSARHTMLLASGRIAAMLAAVASVLPSESSAKEASVGVGSIPARITSIGDPNLLPQFQVCD